MHAASLDCTFGLQGRWLAGVELLLSCPTFQLARELAVEMISYMRPLGAGIDVRGESLLTAVLMGVWGGGGQFS